MSYDKKGYRLGYGKGYYDRYLSSRNTVKIGVCYSQFLSDSIPRGRFDLSVDLIVTEKGIITVSK
jgi:5-formyltetrahydrofolate cyclo-ligase